MSQILNPLTLVSSSNWSVSGGVSFETAISDSTDNTMVKYGGIGGNSFEVLLSSGSVAQAGTGLLTIRARSQGSTINWTLLEGSTQRASGSLSSIPSAFSNLTATISSTVIAAATGWTDWRVRVVGVSAGGEDVAKVQFEIPSNTVARSDLLPAKGLQPNLHKAVPTLRKDKLSGIRGKL